MNSRFTDSPIGTAIFIVFTLTVAGAFIRKVSTISFESKTPQTSVKNATPVLTMAVVDNLKEGQYGYIPYSSLALYNDHVLVEKTKWTSVEHTIKNPVKVSKDSNGLNITLYENIDIQVVTHKGLDAAEVYNLEYSKTKPDFLKKKAKDEATPKEEFVPVEDSSALLPENLIQKTVAQMAVGETKWVGAGHMFCDKDRRVWIKKDTQTNNWESEEQPFQITKISSSQYKLTFKNNWQFPIEDRKDKENYIKFAAISVISE